MKFLFWAGIGFLVVPAIELRIRAYLNTGKVNNAQEHSQA